jgi:dipeptidyl-peptidase 4
MKSIGLFIVAALFLLKTEAQSLTKVDYARAVSFLWQNIVNKKAFNLSMRANWFADSSGFWYLTQSKEGRTYNKWLWGDHQQENLFDQVRLAKILSDTLHANILPTHLPLDEVKYINKKEIELTIKAKTYLLNLDTYEITLKPLTQENEMEKKSPDGKWVAYSDHYNVYLKSTTTGVVRQLSTTGIEGYEYASYYVWGEIIVGENGTRPPHFGISWSPDSKWIQTYICDLRSAKKMYLLDWSVDTLYRARLLSYYRGSPGDTDMVYMTPVYFNVETGEEIRREDFRNVNAVWC